MPRCTERGAKAGVRGPGASSPRLQDAPLVAPPLPWLRPPVPRICGGPRGPNPSSSAIRLESMTSDVHITPEGLEAVKAELRELTTVKRPAIVAKIKAAREFGDLSENFEYHAAKNEQGMMEARINELEAVVKNHVL